MSKYKIFQFTFYMGPIILGLNLSTLQFHEVLWSKNLEMLRTYQVKAIALMQIK